MEDPHPKLPVKGKRNILITSALPYVNNVPHLGNIIGCVLSADVFARYCRLRGYNPIYICGTDEYGATTELKAWQDKRSPREICDKYHAMHMEVYEWFDINFDKFGRTSTSQHTEVCQAIFSLLPENLLSVKTTEQYYCNNCERFLADCLVEGTCPDCGYKSAKGDQCEHCLRNFNETELKDSVCKFCQSTPCQRETSHFFLQLPLLQDKLEDYVKISESGCWSRCAAGETKGWLSKGLDIQGITRDLKWGVPVPVDEFGDKVFYVWFDAPIGYMSITKCYTSEWERWWKNPENVELYQFMGKDNIRFHSLLFPAILLGTGENWTLAKTIDATQYLNYESEKFSKSRGIGIFGDDAKDTNIPVEVWRYYLLSNRPEASDTNFDWDDLQAKLNTELVHQLGNFINRVLKFIAKPSGLGYGSIIPEAPDAESDDLTNAFGAKIVKYVDEYVHAMEKVKLKKGLKIAMTISAEGNAYLQTSDFWKLYKKDLPRCSIVIKSSVGLVLLLACLLEPFMPSFSSKVLKQLNWSSQLSFIDERGDIDSACRPWDLLPAGHKIGTPEPLFKELRDEVKTALKERYSESQTDRLAKGEAQKVKQPSSNKGSGGRGKNQRSKESEAK